MTSTRIVHPSVADRRARGTDARAATPPSSHTGWVPADDRPDPIALLEEQNRTREPDLVPVRHGRMLVSPFTFYRGAAKIMAADLAATPTAGLTVQLCGDAHLCNFGGFASPERRLLFDLNDFDETLPGPFEYDVKRTRRQRHHLRAATRVRQADVKRRCSRPPPRTARRWRASPGCARWRCGTPTSRRTICGSAATSRTAAADGETADGQRQGGQGAKPQTGSHKESRPKRGGASSREDRAQPGTACRRCPNSPSASTGTYRIVSRPPLVCPDPGSGDPATACPPSGRRAAGPRSVPGLPSRRSADDRRHLLDRFQVVDMARKVVGVGSVGTWAFIVLLQGRDDQDPLFLQVQEATSLGAGGPPAQEPLPTTPASGSSRGQRIDAGRQRHLPGLDQGRPGQPRPAIGGNCAT